LTQFCTAHAKNGSVLGPDGISGDASKPGWSTQKAKVIFPFH
jgi:hypothetical protein